MSAAQWEDCQVAFSEGQKADWQSAAGREDAHPYVQSLG